MIKPQGERNVITAPASGYLQFVHLQENRLVDKGDTLCIVHAETLTSQLPALEERKAELEDALNNCLPFTRMLIEF